MTVHDGAQWVFLIGVMGVVLVARSHLRMRMPRVRLALGGAGLLLATLVFWAVMWLPRPWESGFSPLVDATVTAACALFAGLFVLSLSEILGGTAQAIKRWRYYRRDLG